MDEWKKCRMCGEVKQAEDFGRRPGRRDLQAYCRPCFREYAKRWGKRRPPKQKKVDILAGSARVARMGPMTLDMALARGFVAREEIESMSPGDVEMFIGDLLTRGWRYVAAAETWMSPEKYDSATSILGNNR